MLETKVFASLQVILNFFFFFFFFFFLLFQKNWVGRAMGNETFYGDYKSHEPVYFCGKGCSKNNSLLERVDSKVQHM